MHYFVNAYRRISNVNMAAEKCGMQIIYIDTREDCGLSPSSLQ